MDHPRGISAHSAHRALEKNALPETHAVRRLHPSRHMGGRRSSAAEIEGWTVQPFAPLESNDGDEEVTATEVGSTSVARALFAIRERLRVDELEPAPDKAPSRTEVVTMPVPAPPESDIREIAGTEKPDRDPFAVYVDKLMEPAIEVDRAAERDADRVAYQAADAPTLPPPRARKETVKLTAPLRQGTLPMIDPSLLPAPATAPPTDATAAMTAPAKESVRSTVPSNSAPRSRFPFPPPQPSMEPIAPPHPFSVRTASVGFAIGVVLAALIVLAYAHLH
jgi:hypothetical protein